MDLLRVFNMNLSVNDKRMISFCNFQFIKAITVNSVTNLLNDNDAS